MSDILLDTPVSDEDVTTIAARYLTTWQDLTPYLGLDHTQAVAIRKTYFYDYDTQKREALYKWRQIKGDEATYRALITAAKKIPNMQLVGKVKDLLQAKKKSTGKTT